MKTTLTASDPTGWYECEFNGAERCFWWDGEKLRRWPGDEYIHYINYTNFRRLHTEHDVEVIKTDLEKCRDHIAHLTPVYIKLTHDFDHLKQCYDKATAERDNMRVALREKGQAQPYVMRKADAPDCVGLWRKETLVRYYEVTNIEQGFPDGPWYFVGPIPVIPAEQQPPQVVTVKCKKNSLKYAAIPYGDDFVLLNHDGTIAGNASKDDWEVVK